MVQDFVVKAGQGDYAVTRRQYVRDLVTAWAEHTDAVLIVDQQVYEIYAEVLAPLAERFSPYTVPANEDEKTLEGVGRFLGHLQDHSATKSTVVLAIGGGIVQDIVTFATHLYYRGLKWHYAPTTLLGMSDSCIGAKCGINLNRFKNQLGVFHAPAGVTICSEFLGSLPDEDLKSGYGEIIKLHLTGSRGQWEFFKTSLAGGDWRGPYLEELIFGSLLVKKQVIEADEYEKDLRRILNFGHTFGHALEAVTHNAVPHGLAVAWGIDCVNFISWRRGLMSREDFLDIHDCIKTRFGRPTGREVSAEDLVAAARRDKKVQKSKLVLILAAAPGDLRIVPVDFDDRLLAELREYLTEWNVLPRD